MHLALQGATFHVEHVTPTSQGGLSELSNLAWACPGCNLRKGDRTAVPDPDSLVSVPLFHPRNDRWPEHFHWQGHLVVGPGPTLHRLPTFFAAD
jgi:5-methylcytosine-specific restriction endonuclease McrA